MNFSSLHNFIIYIVIDFCEVIFLQNHLYCMHKLLKVYVVLSMIKVLIFDSFFVMNSLCN